MHKITSVQSTLFSEVYIVATTLILSFSSINSTIYATCHESEKQALIHFKQDLKEPLNRLSSWIDNVDCCKWEGVVCKNKSGQVIQLHLQNTSNIISQLTVANPNRIAYYTPDPTSTLSGKINPSLLNLSHLRYLDLSFNNFEGTQIPRFLGSFKNLKCLNLSQAGFHGMIPHQLGNLPNLQTLCVISNSPVLYVDSHDWLVGLSNLEHLDMSYVDLTKVSNWLNVINKIPSLVEVHLPSCNLINSISHLISHNFSSLQILNLLGNHFGTILPRWIFDLNALVSLDLSLNNFEPPWPRGPWNLTSLEILNLFENNINASLPRELINLNNLLSLQLGANHLEGSFPDGIWNLSCLQILDLSNNNFNSYIPSQLITLNGLIALHLGYNNCQGSIPSNIANISNLQVVSLTSNNLDCSLNELFTLNNLTTLLLEDTYFKCPIPRTIRNSTKLKYVDLSGSNLNSAILDDIIVQLGELKNLQASRDFDAQIRIC